MLCVVTVTPPARRARAAATHRLVGGVVYRHLALPPDRKGRLGRRWRRQVGEGPVIAPDLPMLGDLPTFDGTALRRHWMLAAATAALTATGAPPARRAVAVYDPDGRYPSLLLELAPLAGELIVVTDRRDSYAATAAVLMARTGAAIRFDTAARARLVPIGLAPDGLPAGTPHPPLTFAGTPTRCTGVIDGYLPAGADAWFDEVTDGNLRFLDALYEVCHVRALAALPPAAYFCGEKKISLIGAGRT